MWIKYVLRILYFPRVPRLPRRRRREGDEDEKQRPRFVPHFNDGLHFEGVELEDSRQHFCNCETDSKIEEGRERGEIIDLSWQLSSSGWHWPRWKTWGNERVALGALTQGMSVAPWRDLDLPWFPQIWVIWVRRRVRSNSNILEPEFRVGDLS